MKYIHDKIAFRKYIYKNAHCINAGQTPEERKMKYKLALYFGCSTPNARVYRDWRKNTFAKRFGYSSWDNMIKYIAGGDV